jgi:hypothetical protein
MCLALWTRGLGPAIAASLAGLLVASSPALAAGDADPAEAAPTEEIPEIVVEAPEPRYVAPTRRDRIGRIWAPVYINGRGPFRLVLDTGSNRSAVMESVAATLGIAPAIDKPVLLRGVTGARTVPTIPVDKLVVGELELRSQRLPIVTDALGGAEGVLGNEGLQDKRIIIDFRHDRIKIVRSRAERAPPGFVTVPIRMVRGLLLVADIRIGALRAKAIIDTGGQGTLANAAFREALAKKVAPQDILADEITGATLDVQRGDRVLTPPISIGDLEIRQARITVGDLAIFEYWHMTREPALMIGMDVLGLLDTLIIDYKRRELQVRMRKGGF